MPEEVETLLATQSLRLVGGELGVERILVRPWDVRLNFRTGVVPRMSSLQKTLTRYQFAAAATQTFPLVHALVVRTQQEHASPTPPPPPPHVFQEDMPLHVSAGSRVTAPYAPIAEARWVCDHFDLSDLPLRNREAEYPEQAPARSPHDSH